MRCLQRERGAHDAGGGDNLQVSVGYITLRQDIGINAQDRVTGWTRRPSKISTIPKSLARDEASSKQGGVDAHARTDRRGCVLHICQLNPKFTRQRYTDIKASTSVLTNTLGNENMGPLLPGCCLRVRDRAHGRKMQHGHIEV